LYWKVSPTLPDWLFRKSFDFVYGQTRLKIITRRLLDEAQRLAVVGRRD